MSTTRPTPKIAMTPPAPPGPSKHPRRIPGDQSVSLVRSHKRRAPHDQSDSSSDRREQAGSKATDGKTSDGSPSSLQPLGRYSSGESSNAEKWFETSNNDVRGISESFADNDPPFFMRNSSSSETPPELQLQQMRNLLHRNEGSGSLPFRTELLQMGTDGSSTEDFRSVIDDLTVENKKLKRKLKKYEKLQDSHLKDEKLFEVRIHGLPAHKKRELEETLRNFAASLGPNGIPTSGYERAIPTLAKKQTPSSQITDSAYASMSASGQGSSARSGPETRPLPVASTAAQRHQNIHSFLHHIPEGLLPQQNPATMSERTKKKLVVRRLEQVFAGKGAVGGHQHPMQQQEVSQMAARADRAEGEGQGRSERLEGVREARILKEMINTASAKHDVDVTTPDEGAPADNQQQNANGKRPEDAISTDEPQNDQRPTRPLDLDPHRAQVPAENIKYMRHLGFSPLDPDAANSPEEGHGWLYLNLLINMAQLHTINVTPEFIRKALTEHSNKFELSLDGRKVRWKGGHSVTRGSSSGGASTHSRAGPDAPKGRNPRKWPKLSHRESGLSSAPSVERRTGPQENKRLVYTPLFFHKSSADSNDSSDEEEEDDSMSSPWNGPVHGDSSGMTSSGMQTATSRKRLKREDGPIIFYNNARFCTDLSGDRNTNGNANAPPYNTAGPKPIGKPQAISDNKPAETRGPLSEANDLPEAMDLCDNPIDKGLEISFPVHNVAVEEREVPAQLVDLEVTGIGGVYPADNFAVTVKSRQQPAQRPRSHPQTARSLPPKLARILSSSSINRTSAAAIEGEIVSVVKTELPTSSLPEALTYMQFGDESNEDDESDFEDAVSVAPASPGALPPATAPQPVELHYTSEDESQYDVDDDYESDDGSLDMLAAAREIDPDAIREQERAYDAMSADRLAQEIPTGSSAATAGGGSGFASPTSNMSPGEYEKAVKASRLRKNRAAS